MHKDMHKNASEVLCHNQNNAVTALKKHCREAQNFQRN